MSRKQEMRLAIHCRKCLEELPRGVSPKDYSRQQVALTVSGELAVYCNRHDMVIGRLTIGGVVDPKLLAAECACCEGGRHVSG
jgi:hypothetical protein